MKVGLAVNPETPLTTTLSLADSVDSVLFLTVHPGFYGAKFLPEVLDKVVELRARKPNLEIGVDGGIKEGNIAEVARLGVDYICVGSAIFVQPDPAEAFRRLQSLADQGQPIQETVGWRQRPSLFSPNGGFPCSGLSARLLLSDGQENAA